MKLDLKKFKKIGGDANSTTLIHPEGHRITIAHAPLNPKMKEQLNALPAMKMAKGGEIGYNGGNMPTYDLMDKNLSKQNNKMADGGQVDADQEEDSKKRLGDIIGFPGMPSPTPKPKKDNSYADGGNVDKGPWVDPNKAKANEEDSQKVTSLKEGWENLKKGLSEAFDSGSSSSSSDSKAKGGMIKNYDEGGDVKPLEIEKAPDSEQDEQPKDSNQLQAEPVDPNAPENQAPGPQGQPPVVVNVNGAAPAPQMPAPMMQAPQQVPPGIAAPGQPGMPMPANDPYGTVAAQNAYMAGLNQQKAGMIGAAGAQQQLGTAQAEAYQRARSAEQTLMQDYQKNSQALMTERQNLMNDIKNSHVDPNRYLGSMDTGRKISTGIGLLLAGIGSGLTHQPNLAMQFIQKQIDNDIEAQKSDLGKKNNLLAANMNQFNNLNQAVTMTRVMMNDQVANQLGQAGAMANSASAKSAALQGIGKLNADSANMIGQMSMRNTLIGGANKGIIPPEKIVGFLVPQDERPAAMKELQEAQNTSNAKDNILNAFDKLSQINTLANRVEHVGFTPPQVSAIKDPIIAGLSKQTAGRFTEQDAQMVGALFPAPGDSESTINEKRLRLNNLISEKMHFPILKQWGIDANSFGRYNQGGQNSIQMGAPIQNQR